MAPRASSRTHVPLVRKADRTGLVTVKLFPLQSLIELGAVELVVPGVLPIGCFPLYLSMFPRPPEGYGARSGCIKDLNTLSWVHNVALQRKIAELRGKHPDVRIIYADYYTPAIQFVLHAEKYGERACLPH